MPDYRRSIGFVYLQRSKHDRAELFSREKENISPAPSLKNYPGARRLNLPRVAPPGADLWEALARRRSVRKYASEALSLETISLLLWATQGVTARVGHYLLRPAPSAGALYPIETYLCLNDVAGLPPGLVHYDVAAAALEYLEEGDFGQDLAEAAMGQKMCARAPVVFIWSAIARRTMSKYGSRGIRYIFMDVAHICQNLLLAAQALGLGACPVGAFFDDEVNQLLGLDGLEETVVYMAPVGIPA